MSNRGRQNVASYLTLDLGVDWRRGADWFEHHLLDYVSLMLAGWAGWVELVGVFWLVDSRTRDPDQLLTAGRRLQLGQLGVGRGADRRPHQPLQHHEAVQGGLRRALLLLLVCCVAGVHVAAA
jgi:hypothetical protein